MYSVVLMMTLSGGAESVDFGHRCNGCASSHGCHAVARCSGSSCHGCHGGLFSRHGNRCHHACHGGGHCASSCHAVSVGCHGCHGGRGHGCHGGLFSGHRSRCHGCHGGCNGGCYAAGCSGGCAGCTGGGAVVPVGPKSMPKDGKKGTEEVSIAPATIVVTLPAEAKLTVDGNATRATSARRTFVTPALEVGGDYSYTLRAEMVQDGQVAVQTQNVTVRGGETTEVSFTFASQGVASR